MNVVDLAKEPDTTGSLARSTTLKMRFGNALIVHSPDHQMCRRIAQVLRRVYNRAKCRKSTVHPLAHNLPSEVNDSANLGWLVFIRRLLPKLVIYPGEQTLVPIGIEKGQGVVCCQLAKLS